LNVRSSTTAAESNGFKGDQLAIRVLIVEDSKRTTGCLCDWLEDIGGFHVVGAARSEMDATDWLQRHAQGWDVAILDLMIESGSGFNLIRRARQSAPGGKPVVFSAYATPVVAQRCIELGAEAVFEKSDTDRFLAYLKGLESEDRTSGQPARPR
jgi:DNA-binding NarL/FixJ family response regulator